MNERGDAGLAKAAFQDNAAYELVPMIWNKHAETLGRNLGLTITAPMLHCAGKVRGDSDEYCFHWRIVICGQPFKSTFHVTIGDTIDGGKLQDAVEASLEALSRGVLSFFRAPTGQIREIEVQAGKWKGGRE